jgi:protein phosphatase
MTRPPPDPNVLAIFDVYKRYFHCDLSTLGEIGNRLQLPVVPIPILIAICDAVTALFKYEPSLLRLTVPTMVVGDLHGHIVDLFRTIGRFGLPPSYCYLFLGDLVDRGEFSTETTILIFVLKLIYPDFIYIIRGNHEFMDMAQSGGFCDELRSLYNTSRPETAIMAAFSYLPLAAMIGDHVLCVHGGLGPSMETLSQLDRIPRPITICCDDILQSLLWSDPIASIDGYRPSARGMGYHFGADVLSQFLDSQNLLYLLRGHECVDGGVEAQLGRRMYTVFGASNYCGKSGNKAGVLLVQPTGEKEPFFFAPAGYIRRTQAAFVRSESEATFQIGGNRRTSGPAAPGKLPMLAPAQGTGQGQGQMQESSRARAPSSRAEAGQVRVAPPVKRISPVKGEAVSRAVGRRVMTFT